MKALRLLIVVLSCFDYDLLLLLPLFCYCYCLYCSFTYFTSWLQVYLINSVITVHYCFPYFCISVSNIRFQLSFLASLLYRCRRVCDWKWRHWCSVWTSRIRIRRSCKPYRHYECSPSGRAILLSFSSTRTLYSNISTHCCSFGEKQKRSDCPTVVFRLIGSHCCASRSADSSDIVALTFTARFCLIIVKCSWNVFDVTVSLKSLLF